MSNGFDIQTLVRENVKALRPYSSARDEFKDFDRDLVFLDANENPFATGLNRYPDPHQRSVKAHLAASKKIGEAQILLGNGSDEVLDLIFRAFCEPQVDNCITLPPTYGMYGVLAATNAVENREVLLTQGFQPDVDSIFEQIDGRSKLLFLCSPNNPTGNSFKEEIVAELLSRFRGIVVIDEAYIDFSNSASWLDKLGHYPNLVITQTLSKAYGLAGLRLGICYASEEIIGTLKKIKPPYNVNVLTQKKVLERLKDGDAVQKEVDRILFQRSQLLAVLKTIPYIKTVFETDANFILVRVDDARKRYGQLLEQGVVIRNRSTQPLCENTLRFTVGTQEENQKLIEALKQAGNG